MKKQLLGSILRSYWFDIAGAMSLIQIAMWTSPGFLRKVMLISTLSFMVLTTLVRRVHLRDQGLSLTGVWSSAWLILAVLVVAGMAITLAQKLGTWHELPNPLARLAGYYLKALIEQWGLVYFFTRLRKMMSVGSAQGFTALLFCLMHLPNPILMPLALMGGWGSAALFHRYRTIFTLAAIHAITAVTILLCVPADVHRNFRVGASYFLYTPHSVAAAYYLVIAVTGLILVAAVVALFNLKVRARLEWLFAWHPQCVVAIPVLLTVVDLYFRGFTSLLAPIVMLICWGLVLALLYRAKHTRAVTIYDGLAVVLLWLTFDFHAYGGYYAVGKSDWPVIAVSLSILTVVYWRDFRVLEGMKVIASTSWQDWRWLGNIFTIMAIALIPLALLTGFVHLAPSASVQSLFSWRFVGTFIAIAITIALGEELIFRGIIQNLLDRTIRSPIVSLICASLIFGATHLHKRWDAAWPPSQWNWRYMALASLAGMGYGWLFRKTKSIIFPTLLHALVDSVWHTLFR